MSLSKCESQDFNPSSLAPKPTHLTTVLCSTVNTTPTLLFTLWQFCKLKPGLFSCLSFPYPVLVRYWTFIMLFQMCFITAGIDIQWSLLAEFIITVLCMLFCKFPKPSIFMSVQLTLVECFCVRSYYVAT